MSNDEVREIVVDGLINSSFSAISTDHDRAEMIIATLAKAGYLILKREEVEAGWIKCSDQMPANRSFVLATGPRCRSSCMDADPKMMVMYYDEDWWDANDDFELFCGNVTHWMPLPKSPASVKAGET